MPRGCRCRFAQMKEKMHQYFRISFRVWFTAMCNACQRLCSMFIGSSPPSPGFSVSIRFVWLLHLRFEWMACIDFVTCIPFTFVWFFLSSYFQSISSALEHCVCHKMNSKQQKKRKKLKWNASQIEVMEVHALRASCTINRFHSFFAMLCTKASKTRLLSACALQVSPTSSNCSDDGKCIQIVQVTIGLAWRICRMWFRSQTQRWMFVWFESKKIEM